MSLTQEQMRMVEQRVAMLEHYARVIGDLAKQLEAEMDVMARIIEHGLKNDERLPESEVESTFIETMGSGRVEVPADQAAE